MPRSESLRPKFLLVVSMILVGSLAACERRTSPPQPKTSAAAPAPAAPAATPAAPPPASAPAAAAASSVSDADKTFVDQAVASGMTEVALTAHTMDKAASPRVKEIATLLNTDHTATNQELGRLATKKGVAVPATPKEDKQAEIKQIRGLTGADLDNAVLPKLAEAHRKSIELYERQAKEGGDADLKLFAQKTLPVLRSHLKQLESVQAGRPAGQTTAATGASDAKQ